MIKNDKQLKVAQNRLNELRVGLKKLKQQDMDDFERQLHTASLEGVIQEISKEIEEFKAAQNGVVEIPDSYEVSSLGRVLILTRIALGWTQKELGEKVYVKKQQIQRYEDKEYSSASFSTVSDIAELLFEEYRNLNRVECLVAYKHIGYTSSEVSAFESSVRNRRAILPIAV